MQDSILPFKFISLKNQSFNSHMNLYPNKFDVSVWDNLHIFLLLDLEGGIQVKCHSYILLVNPTINVQQCRAYLSFVVGGLICYLL